MSVMDRLAWLGCYLGMVGTAVLLYPLFVLRNLPRLLFTRGLFPLGSGLIVLDQLLKWGAVEYFKNKPSLALIPGWLSITYVENRGAAFGLFRGQITAFILIALFTVAVILVYLSMVDEDEKLVPVALVLILAGAVGNLIDRATLGYVIDYIDVHYYDVFKWPVFNLADTIIDVGVGLIILDVLLDARRGDGEESKAAS